MPPFIGTHQMASSVRWLRMKCKACNSGAVKLLRRLVTDTIILYLKHIFKKTFTGLPFFLSTLKLLRIKKPLCLKFNEISYIKPKVKTTFTSLKGFHENKDDVRCEIKNIAGLLPYIILVIPSKH